MTVTEIITRKKEENCENAELLAQLRRINCELENAYERFELMCESDLVEATIYEIESLRARYRYLLGVAKSKNLKANEVLFYGS